MGKNGLSKGALQSFADLGAAICKHDICDAALVMAAARPTFSAHDFTEFLSAAGFKYEDDDVNDWLVELVERGRLREVGPAVYAARRAN